MSAPTPHPAAYPYAWLQPVTLSLEEYRQFAEALDGDLADLVATHGGRHRVATARNSPANRRQDRVIDTQPFQPPN